MGRDRANEPCYTAPTVMPNDQEPICPISFTITRIQVGGGPDTRAGFWTKYRQNREHNVRTEYRNERVRLCADQVPLLGLRPGEALYYRHGRLVSEREAHRPSGPELA